MENVPELDMFFLRRRIDKKTAETLLDRFPNARIYNTYAQQKQLCISSIQINQHVLDKYDRLPIGYVKRHQSFYCPRRQTCSKRRNRVRSLLQGQAYQKVTPEQSRKTAAAFFLSK